MKTSSSLELGKKKGWIPKGEILGVMSPASANAFLASVLEVSVWGLWLEPGLRLTNRRP